MTIVQQLNQAKAERDLARQKLIEMEADLSIAVNTLQEAIQLLKVDKHLKKTTKSNKPIQSFQVLDLVKLLTPMFTSGKANKEKLFELWDKVSPIIPKYNYLIETATDTNSEANTTQ